MLRVSLTRPVTGTNSRTAGHIIQQDRVRKAYHMEAGTLTVSAKLRRFRRHNPHLSETAREENADGIEDFTAKLRYFPDSRTGSMFEATSKQRMVWNGTFSSIPRLQANRVLPNNSLVFQLVRAGRIADFEALLREGKASLRDHDEWGNSLLVVSTNLIFQPIIFTLEGVTKGDTNLPLQMAVTESQPQMCRFLLSNHADVEVYGVEASDYGRGSFRVNILDLGPNLFEADAKQLKRILPCYKSLLEAGADPTDNTDRDGNDENGENGISPFFGVFTSGNVVGAIIAMCYFLICAREAVGQRKQRVKIVVTLIMVDADRNR